MAVVQSAYAEDHAKAVAGMIANTTTCDVDSMRIEGTSTTAIDFGVAVQQGTAYDQAEAGIATATFRGVTVLDKTLNPGQNDTYVVGDIASILYRGDIWVEVEAAVTVGANVTADTTTGQLSTAAVSNSQILIAGATWVTAAAADGLAIVRFSGELPSA